MMEKTSNTPGPWHLATDGISPMITDANGNEVYIGANEANARLIAAAPDMLNALQALAIVDFGAGKWSTAAEQAAVMARKAIAKATCA